MSTENQMNKNGNLTLVEWCNQQVTNGHELTLCWDGGGDSGWIYLEIDGQQTEDEYSEALISHLEDVLNYGSWAGEFGANGKANYDVEQKAFVGVDYYHETDSYTYEANIVFSVPKDLWFNELEIHIENDNDSTIVNLEFVIKNGFKTTLHSETETQLVNYLPGEIDTAINDFIQNTDHEFNSIWDDIRIDFSDGKVNGDYREFTITDVEMRYNQTVEKDIYLNVADIELPINLTNGTEN